MRIRLFNRTAYNWLSKSFIHSATLYKVNFSKFLPLVNDWDVVKNYKIWKSVMCVIKTERNEKYQKHLTYKKHKYILGKKVKSIVVSLKTFFSLKHMKNIFIQLYIQLKQGKTLDVIRVGKKFDRNQLH